MSRLVPIHDLALASFVAEIELRCQDFRGRVKVEAEREEAMKWPQLGIRLIKAPLVRSNRRKHATVTGGIVYDVGHFEALLQLRLGAPTHHQRMKLGEQVAGAFMADEDRAGVMVTRVPEVHAATCSWELDEQGWQDEAAFAKKWWSVTTVTGLIPCFVRTDVYRVEDLRLILRIGSSIPLEQPQLGPTETIRVNEDGSTTKL